MSTCYCCKRRTAVLCSCVISTCRECLFCLTHCRCAVKGGRMDPAKMAAVDSEDGLDDPSGPFADLQCERPGLIAPTGRLRNHREAPTPRRYHYA